MTKEMIMEVKEKPKGLYGIPEIMKGVMNTQRNHVERTREAEKEKKPIVLLYEYEKKETKIPEQPNSFKDFAEGMKKVECVECKSKVSLAECNYDPARNRYTCHKCDKKLKEAERARKEAKTREQIKNLEGGIK
jgi:hypothetical protein